MLTKQLRLTKDRDFKRVNARGRSVFSSKFKIKFIPNGLTSSRFAIITSSKLSKKATQRNRVRRQLSEITRHHHDQVASGQDIVVWVKPPALGQPYQDLEQDFLSLLTKAKLIR